MLLAGSLGSAALAQTADPAPAPTPASAASAPAGTAGTLGTVTVRDKAESDGSTTSKALLRATKTEIVVGRKVGGSEALGQLHAIREVPGWRFLPD